VIRNDPEKNSKYVKEEEKDDITHYCFIDTNLKPFRPVIVEYQSEDDTAYYE